MGDSTADRNSLEELWRGRLRDAKLLLQFAQNYVSEVQRDLDRGELAVRPSVGSRYQNALLTERMALLEYQRVQSILDHLVTKGTIPDEHDWLMRQAAGVKGWEEPPAGW